MLLDLIVLYVQSLFVLMPRSQLKSNPFGTRGGISSWLNTTERKKENGYTQTAHPFSFKVEIYCSNSNSVRPLRSDIAAIYFHIVRHEKKIILSNVHF